jgi:hypothetical protein
MGGMVTDSPAISDNPVKSKKPIILIGSIFVLLILVVGAVLLLSLLKSNNSSALSTANQFVYDITHNKSAAAYSLTTNTGTGSLYSENGFATNVANLSKVTVGPAKETNFTTKNTTDSKGANVVIKDATYSLPVKDQTATVDVDVFENNGQWKVISLQINPSSGTLAGIFNGTVGSYQNQDASSPSSSSSGSSTAQSSSSSSASSSCPSSSGTGLTCYPVPSSNGIPGYSILFFSGASISSPDSDVSQISSSVPSSGGQIVAQITGNGTGGSDSTCQSGTTEAFTYTSNGASEIACSDTVSGSYQYDGTVNFNGGYFINLVSPSALSTTTVEAIFSSVTYKP